MTTTPDRGDAADGGAGDGYDDGALSLVVNALADLDGDRRTLADDESVRAVREAFEAATGPGEREAFEAALAERRASVESAERTPGHDDAVLGVVRAVTDELAARDARFRVDHECPVSFPGRTRALYRFARTRDPDALGALSLSGPVRERVAAAGDALRGERYGEAARTLVGAVEAARTHDDAVASRVAAGWAHLWAGDAPGAVDLVEETLHLDTGAWEARQLGVAAGHDSPRFFREDRLAAAVYLRARVAEPDGTRVEAALGERAGAGNGNGDGSDDATTWRDLPGPLTCVPLESLPADGRLRFRLTGGPRAVPSLRTYYLGVGVVEPASRRARTVERVLLDGPDGAATETLRIRTGR